MDDEKLNLPADFRIWEGVFDDFPSEDPEGAFSTARWINQLAQEAGAGLADLTAAPVDAAAPTVTLTHEYPLPILVALAASGFDRTIRVLDFGGGMASSYASVAGVLPPSVSLVYEVVELPALCDRGRALFADYPNIRFLKELPEIGSYDIVHAAAAMQYVRDWRGLIKKMASYGPEWMAFGHLLAGPITTFVTRQNAYGKRIPVRFLAIEEFLGVMHQLHYKMIYKALMIRTILGREQPLPTDHFPVGKRLRYGCNLIFRRERRADAERNA